MTACLSILPHGNVRLCLTLKYIWGQFPLMLFFSFSVGEVLKKDF